MKKHCAFDGDGTRVGQLRFQISIKSTPLEVTHVVSDANKWMISHGIEDDMACELELVLAEALNNVVEHAYEFASDGKIEITITLRPTRLTATITDQGQKFDGPPPLREMDIENMAFEELPDGGFGWNLIRTLTDAVEFEHKNQTNCLTLTRHLDVALAI